MHRPIFTTLGEMTDADKIMNSQHLWSNPVPADIRILIRINPEIRIRIPVHLWLRLDVLVEIGAVRAQSSLYCRLFQVYLHCDSKTCHSRLRHCELRNDDRDSAQSAAVQDINEFCHLCYLLILSCDYGTRSAFRFIFAW